MQKGKAAVKLSMIMAITPAAIEATKAAIMAVNKAENLINTANSLQVMSRRWYPALKLLLFN